MNYFDLEATPEREIGESSATESTTASNISCSTESSIIVSEESTSSALATTTTTAALANLNISSTATGEFY